MIDTLAIKARFEALEPFLGERDRRLWAASEADAAGRGGIMAVSAVTGIARSTIGRGLDELGYGKDQFLGRIRRPGGGRKPKTETEPGLLDAPHDLVQSAIRGDPEAALLWVSRSQRYLARALAERGYSVGQKLVGRLLRPTGQPEPVRVHDFALPELGKVAPYGVYDIAANTGWVNLGITCDTAAFAVQSIRRWWQELGQPRYSGARRLLITADCGGSNGVRVRLWKTELQMLANQTGLSITVAHLPPGTSKWNRVEHRLFAFITQNWRGQPLLTYQVIVQLIANTTTQKGLTVQCRLDQNIYEKGTKVSDDEMARLNITRAEFHGEWNYTIAPQRLES